MTRYELPALRTVRWIAVESMPALTALPIPAAASLEGGISIKRTGLTSFEWNGSSSLVNVVIEENAALASVSFPNVSAATDVLRVDVLSSIDFRSLKTAGTVELLTHNAGAQIQLRALTTASSLQIGTRATSLALDSLQSVTNTLRLSTEAVSLALPELVSCSTFMVDFNPYLTNLSAPKLRTVTNSFSVTFNPKLPTCRAVALAAQLVPRPPSVTTSDNYDAGTCN